MSKAPRTYDNNIVVSYPPGQIDYYTTATAVPNTCSCGAVSNATLNYSADDILQIKEYKLEFTLTTNDTTNHPIFFNPFLILNEIKYEINNQTVTHHQNTEAIYAAVRLYLSHFSEEEYWSQLQKCRVEKGKTYNGDNGSGGTIYFSLPLTWLFNELKNIDSVSGMKKISFYWRFNPDYGTAALNGRFVRSATAVNAWANSRITMTDILVRQCSVRYTAPQLIPRSPNSLMLLHKFELKQYSVTWNTVNTDLQRILQTDFSAHTKNLGYVCYLYPAANVTAYNDVDCCKVIGDSATLGFSMRSKGRVFIDFTNAVRDARNRVAYVNEVHERRYEKTLIVDLESNVNDSNKFFLSPLMIDLANFELLDADMEGIGGVSNVSGTNDIEVVLTCATALGAGTHTLNVLTHYVEVATIDPKTGVVSIAQ